MNILCKEGKITHKEASTFIEDAAFNGNDLTFSGYVVSNTIDTNLYTASFFIKGSATVKKLH